MKNRLIFLIVVMLLSFQSFSQTAKHVIFITIDGFRPDFYLAESWHTPNIHALMQDGAYAKAVNPVFPSITYPNHTTIITGVGPSKHGIYYNSIFEQQGSTGKIYWQDSSIHAPTLWSAAKQKGLVVASLFWPVSAGAPVDINIPDIGAKGEAIREQFTKPQGFIAALKKEVFGNADSIDYGKNQNVGKIAAYVIKKSKPDLMMVHVFSVDHAQHLQGRNGLMVEEAVSDADETVGIIVNALKESGIWENTVLFVGGDHGFYNIAHNLSPNTWLKNAGLMNNVKNNDWKAQFNNGSGGSTFLYLKNPSDKITLEKVMKILDDQPDSIKQYFRILTRKQLDKADANPEVALALTAEHDASFNNTLSGGTHGHFPDTKQIKTGLILHGPGIHRGAVIEEMDMRDMASIISQVLNISLPKSEGKIPKGLLILK